MGVYLDLSGGGAGCGGAIWGGVYLESPKFPSRITTKSSHAAQFQIDTLGCIFDHL